MTDTYPNMNFFIEFLYVFILRRGNHRIKLGGHLEFCPSPTEEPKDHSRLTNVLQVIQEVFLGAQCSLNLSQSRHLRVCQRNLAQHHRFLLP